MIGIHALLLFAQTTPIILRPLQQLPPLSRDRYEVACELRDVQSAKSYRVAFSQYGGTYQQLPGKTYGGRLPTFVRFSRDDLGIFGVEPMDMTGNKITAWQEDGPFELSGLKGGRGGYTFYKTARRRPYLQSPAKIAVTVRGGRIIKNVAPSRSVEEFLLSGSSDVAWKSQQAMNNAPGAREAKQ